MPKLDDDTDFVMSTLWSRINSNDSIPEYIWLATGGKNGCFNEQNFDVKAGMLFCSLISE